MLPVLTVLTLLTKKHKFWDKEWAWDDGVDELCDMLLMLTVLTLRTKRDKFWDKVEARDDNVDGCCYMLLLWWLVLTDVDESLFSRILVYFVVKISTHLDLGYATGAIDICLLFVVHCFWQVFDQKDKRLSNVLCKIGHYFPVFHQNMNIRIISIHEAFFMICTPLLLTISWILIKRTKECLINFVRGRS